MRFLSNATRELQTGYEDIKAQDTEIIAISADSQALTGITKQSLG